MIPVFADASFYIAVGNPRDQWHTAARNFSVQYSGLILTTEYVLLEVGNYLSPPSLRTSFCQLVRQLQVDTKTQIVASSSELWSLGLELHERRRDKDW